MRYWLFGLYLGKPGTEHEPLTESELEPLRRAFRRMHG
jgi:hypothetical protein